jgi:hypothetical protein
LFGRSLRAGNLLPSQVGVFPRNRKRIRAGAAKISSPARTRRLGRRSENADVTGKGTRAAAAQSPLDGPQGSAPESPTACGGICLAAGDPDKSGTKRPRAAHPSIPRRWPPSFDSNQPRSGPEAFSFRAAPFPHGTAPSHKRTASGLRRNSPSVHQNDHS